MGKSKKKKTKSPGTMSWMSENLLNETRIGCVKDPIWILYPHLKYFIFKTNNSFAGEGFAHPFAHELDTFELKYVYLKACNRVVECSVPNTFPIQWVSTSDELANLCQHLKTKTHIYFDLEGHSFRSYRGITCLLQISDGENVFFVDTLKLFHHMKQLQPIMKDPNVIKVFHGSANDIKWLQRDFSLFIVGLMDTQIMHHVLYKSNNIGYKGLVHEFFPNAGLDKAVRNTDFRQRPLHQDQQKYAFLDVHYLPYLYYKLLQAMTPEKLHLCVTLCKDISLTTYSHPKLLLELESDTEELRQLKRVRDIVARKEDVNPELLCSIQALLNLVIRKSTSSDNKISITPKLNNKFLKYPDAISVALQGKDATSVFETVYRDLGIPFPQTIFMFCFNCEGTDHVKRECPFPKSLGKELKRKHYLTHPEKKAAECKRRNAKVKNNPVLKKRKNRRDNLRKLRRRIKSIIQSAN